jgi:hypothetical protein
MGSIFSNEELKSCRQALGECKTQSEATRVSCGQSLRECRVQSEATQLVAENLEDTSSACQLEKETLITTAFNIAVMEGLLRFLDSSDRDALNQTVAEAKRSYFKTESDVSNVVVLMNYGQSLASWMTDPEVLGRRDSWKTLVADRIAFQRGVIRRLLDPDLE